MTLEEKIERDRAAYLALINGAKPEAVASRYDISLRTLERRVMSRVRQYKNRAVKPSPVGVD